ncbi:hypothetical protein ACFRJ9_00430 [Paenarthrobacter sp. NPDC056912]|uniref:hypothetical protein n=1 Tax=Paenarthrobacter sp. NPDC056912 TaxID=3345965 RepID=UPI00366A7B15
MTNSGKMTPAVSHSDGVWRLRDSVLAAVNGTMAALAGVGGVISAMEVIAGADAEGRAAAGYFAVRAVVIALAVLILAIKAIASRRPGPLPVVLLGAAAVQFADVPISILAGNSAVAIAAFVLGAVHLTTAWLLRRR